MPKAVRFDDYGGRDILYLAEVDRPRPGAGEVLVAVKAAGINPGEAAIREGKLAEQFRAEFPSGPGNDFAGVVDEVGSDVSDVSVGDEVLGWSERRSSHAEFVVVPAGQVVPKPAGLAWEVAGSLYVAGVTAWVAVDAVGALQGDTLAVPAAAGGVGSISVQLLRLRGATVIGIASPPHHDWLVSVGVLPVAYDDRDGLADRIRDAAPGMVDAFIDTYGREYVELAVTLGVEPSRIDTIISFDAAERCGAKAQGGQAAADPAAMLRQLADLAASGRLQVPIAAIYPLTQVRDAFAELEARHARGNIALFPAA